MEVVKTLAEQLSDADRKVIPQTAKPAVKHADQQQQSRRGQSYSHNGDPERFRSGGRTFAT